MKIGLVLVSSVLFLAQSSFLHAELDELKIIKEIKIEGYKNFKVRKVRELIRTRPKDFYSVKALEEDIREILSSGNFESADFEVEEVEGGYRVVYKVKERPWIRRIDFTGNKKIRKGKLKEEISLKNKEGFDETMLDGDIQTILSLYGEKGYPDCKVEPFTSFSEEDNWVAINFIIDEGNRVLIERVDFEGNTAFKDKKLRRVLKKTRRKKVYNSEKLREDMEILELFYKNNGYAKVELGKTSTQYNEERTRMVLTIPITENQRFVVGDFEFYGHTIYESKDLRKVLELKTNKLYNEEKYQESLQNLRELYLEKGYLNATIEPEDIEDEDENRINYRFTVVEGTVFFIDRVYIEGNKKTKEKVFRREVQLKPGDPFSSSKIRRSQEKILNLGFIDDVKPDIQPGREPNKVDLIMDIVEGKPGSLSAGAGFSSVDGLVGQIQLGHSNLFGLAQKLNVLWEFGARRQNYQITWTEPWLMDKPLTFGVDIFNTQREVGSTNVDFRQRRTGGGLRMGPRFSDIWSLLFSYSIENVTISNLRDALRIDPNNTIVEGTDLTSSFGIELARDTRDYFFDASRGNRNSISVRLAGGPVFQGDVHFVKPVFNTSWFWTVFNIGNYPFVFSLNGQFGGVQKYPPSTSVPIQEKFFVGGADSVRGYGTRNEIGPPEKIGGQVFTVMNAEYKIPLYVERKRRILQLVLFADIGGAWTRGSDITTQIGKSEDDKTNEKLLKSSIGFGLRITTPVFPIRLDWGYGLNHRDRQGEDVSQIHFTLGNLF